MNNFEIEEIADQLELSNFYCVCKNQIKDIMCIDLPLNIIVNINNSENNTSGQWATAFLSDKESIYYSLFGDDPPLEVIDFMKKQNLGKLILSSNF